MFARLYGRSRSADRITPATRRSIYSIYQPRPRLDHGGFSPGATRPRWPLERTQLTQILDTLEGPVLLAAFRVRKVALRANRSVTPRLAFRVVPSRVLCNSFSPQRSPAEERRASTAPRSSRNRVRRIRAGPFLSASIFMVVGLLTQVLLRSLPTWNDRLQEDRWLVLDERHHLDAVTNRRLRPLGHLTADLYYFVTPGRAARTRAGSADGDYTPDKRSSSPVLSPNLSRFTPNLSIRLRDRFANGVPFGYLR